jgi:hypothetical protein
MLNSLKKLGLVGIIIILVFAAGGCVVRPPHHPYPFAPGNLSPLQAQHHYRYFPDSQVYYDTTGATYFYLDNGVWLSGLFLPDHLHIDSNYYVNMELDSPRPYLYHRDTIKRHPPRARRKQPRIQGKKRVTSGDDRRGLPTETGSKVNGRANGTPQVIIKPLAKGYDRQERGESGEEKQEITKAVRKAPQDLKKEGRAGAGEKGAETTPPDARRSGKTGKQKDEEESSAEKKGENHEEEELQPRQRFWK